LYFEDKDVKPGLPLYPDLYLKKGVEIKHPGLHACAYCGNVEEINKPGKCSVCGEDEWVLAIKTLRKS
jgi:hypothetical protein